MIIGILGFSLDERNKGCEALTYSFLESLRKILKKNIKIINFSDSSSKKIASKFMDFDFIDCPFNKKNFGLKLLKNIMKCDIIFDCTFGDNFSDIYSLPYAKSTTLRKEIILLLRKKFVLAPQTIGPFSDRNLRKRAAKIMKKSMMVFSRDIISTNYVKRISGVNAVTVTDLAFMLPYNKQKVVDNKIGINISGLLWNGGFSGDNQFSLKTNYKEYVEQLIIRLQKLGYDVCLIPHVLDHNVDEIDEDYNLCCNLSKKFNLECPPFFDDPIQAKSYISGMKYFVGARMHSTVAAFSSGVITIPFSYSRKFEGLYHSLNYPYIINGRRLETEVALRKTIEYITKKAEKLEGKQICSMTKIKMLEDYYYKKMNQIFASI